MAIGLLCMIFASTGLANTGKPLLLVSIPWQKTDTLQQIYKPMMQYLEAELNKPVQLYVSKDYKELSDRLVSGAADLGILGGNSYVDAKERYPDIQYVATCMQPTEYYQSLIIVRRDSGIKTLPDLAGKSFAFTDKKSTSGYLYPLLMLVSNGIVPETDFSITYFLRKHDKVYDAVAKKVIDAGGVSKTAFDKAVERNSDVFDVLAASDPIPRNAVVAAPHLTTDKVQQLQQLLSRASKSRFFRQSDSILKGFVVKDDSFYDIVREARKLRQ